jgi:hypothetical protein
MNVIGGESMSEPVFRIPRKKYGGDTTVVSMRISRELLKDIDKVADLSGRNRNEILTMSLEFALKHTEILLQEDKE